MINVGLDRSFTEDENNRRQISSDQSMVDHYQIGTKKYFFISFYIALFVVLITIVLLFFVTRTAIFDSFTFTDKTSAIGDTIGGVGNVVVGCISAILLFFSFWMQRIANNEQIKRFNLEKVQNKKLLQNERFNKSFEDIKKRLFRLELIQIMNMRTPKICGIEAINYFIDHPDHPEFNSFLSRITYLLDSIYNLLLFVNIDMIDPESKVYFTLEIETLYKHYLKETSKKIILSSCNDKYYHFHELYDKIESHFHKNEGNVGNVI